MTHNQNWFCLRMSGFSFFNESQCIYHVVILFVSVWDITGKDVGTCLLHQSSLTQFAGSAFTHLLCWPPPSPGIAHARLQPSSAFVSADCLVLVIGINEAIKWVSRIAEKLITLIRVVSLLTSVLNGYSCTAFSYWSSLSILCPACLTDCLRTYSTCSCLFFSSLSITLEANAQSMGASKSA